MPTNRDADRPEVNPAYSSTAEAELLRATERERLHALVEADMGVVRRLHADDFQLITPSGLALLKEQNLERVASGELDYRVWEPDSPIEVGLYGYVAFIRYCSKLAIIDAGHEKSLRPYWHTDAYEQRIGGWQVVWSQATEIR
jgi:Domain of unknown function (DUF4440)